MSKPTKIIFNCKKCNNKYETTKESLKYRTNYANEHICKSCISKLQRLEHVFKVIPNNMHYQIFNGCIDYDIAIKYLKNISTKLNIKFNCRVCNKEHKVRWHKFEERQNYKYDNICYHCITIAINNDPKMLKINRDRSKKLWNNNEYRKACIKAFHNHNHKMQTNQEYANKHKRKSKSISGEILVKSQWIRFDSAYELIFLWHIAFKCDIIRRCNFVIPYGNHFYHPDFLIINNDGSRHIIEIKGFYKNKVQEKQKAAIKYIKESKAADSYILYDTNLLIKEGIIKIGSTWMWRKIKEINNETSIKFSNKKHKEIAKIGRYQYYKKMQNK